MCSAVVSGTGLALVHCCTLEFASHLHVVCVGPGPAQPRGTWSLHRVGGGTSFTPHTVTLTAGHLAALPGGSDLAQPKRVFLTATVRGHEMTSYRWLLVLAIMRCGVYAEVGRGQVLVPVQWRFCVGLVYSDPTSIFRHFMHNILSAHWCFWRSFVGPLIYWTGGHKPLAMVAIFIFGSETETPLRPGSSVQVRLGELICLTNNWQTSLLSFAYRQ